MAATPAVFCTVAGAFAAVEAVEDFAAAIVSPIEKGMVAMLPTRLAFAGDERDFHVRLTDEGVIAVADVPAAAEDEGEPGAMGLDADPCATAALALPDTLEDTLVVRARAPAAVGAVGFPASTELPPVLGRRTADVGGATNGGAGLAVCERIEAELAVVPTVRAVAAFDIPAPDEDEAVAAVVAFAGTGSAGRAWIV
jgi:hypothetical protein